MKSILYIIVISACFNFVTAQNQELKSFKRDGYKLEYPKSWKKVNFYGYTLFVPRDIHKLNKRGVQVRIFPNYLRSTNKGKSIKDLLLEHAQTTFPHKINKTYVISILDSNKFQYKIEYEYNVDFYEEIHKKVEYIRLEKSSLKYYSYSAKKQLFNQYFDEAKQIIYSVDKR